MEINGPQPNKVKDDIFNKSLSLTQEYAIECMKTRKNYDRIGKAIINNLTIGARI